MKTSHVERSYQTYHGTVYDTSFNAYDYSGAKEYQALRELTEKAVPLVKSTTARLLAEHRAKRADLNQKADDAEVEWKKKPLWFRFANAPGPYYAMRCDATRIPMDEYQDMKQLADNSARLVEALDQYAGNQSLFVFRDENNRVVSGLTKFMKEHKDS